MRHLTHDFESHSQVFPVDDLLMKRYSISVVLRKFLFI